ncbi:tape measure protein [Siphonobacter sp. SORGH_AS_0500]|uniref:tape measure protein n=1 Tax=Siphonobacter sp. SORGH_AS_0500 TaxID=1864824 RepID=UPI002862B426|nr:tape measure protein [Siphonobacter sp. SORGH_AS_0500]MDR6195922.1 phage-related protein [Siphonobacter sp. SORGH_AS_0500]
MIQDEIKIQFTGEAAGLNNAIGGATKSVKTFADTWEEADKAAKAAEKTVVQLEKAGKKNSEEWEKAKKAAREYREEADKAAQAIKKTDAATLTYQQLENYVKKVTKELKGLTPGTEAFIAKTAELQSVKKRLDDVKNSVAGTTTELGKASKATQQVTKDLLATNNTSLTFNELKAKVELLRKKMAELPIESKEFVTASKQLTITEKYYENVKKRVNEGTQAIKEKREAVEEAQRKELLATKDSELSYSKLKEKVALLRAEVEKLPPKTMDFTNASKKLQETEKHFASVGKEIKGVKQGGEDLAKPGIWDKITGGVNGVKTAFAAFFALQVVQFFWDIGKAIFETTGKFEKYETTLGNLLGSQEKAKGAMQALKDIAAKTPFAVDTLTDSYVKMVARGLKPSEDQIKRMGDAAAKMNKPFDQLMEAVLDVSNTERWNEIGIKVSKVGDKIKTNIGGSTRYFDATEQGALEMAVAFGSTTDAMGLMEKQSGTLSGRMDSIKDVFEQVYGALGERLRPVFNAFLLVVGKLVGFLMECVQSSKPLVLVFEDLWGAVTQLFDVLMGLVYDMFPGLKNQTISASGYVKALAQVFAGVVAVFKLAVAAVQLVVDSFFILGQTAKAIGNVVEMALTGDFKNIGKVWDGVKNQFTATKNHLIGNFDSIKNGIQAALVDYPKDKAAKGMLPVKDAHDKAHKEMTETQKKEQEKREKAADASRKRELKAIDETYKQQQEAHIATLSTEIERERAKVELKYELLKRQAERETKAGHELTVKLKEIEEQRKADLQEVEAKHLAKVKEANQKALQQLAELEAEAQINRISDELLREEARIKAKKDKRIAEINATLADEVHKQKLRAAAEDEATAEIERKREEHRKKEAEKEAANLQKQLEYRKNIINQQQQAEMALFDLKELQAKGHAGKLAEIYKDRVDRELYWTKEKLKAEEDAELGKAALTLKNTDELKAAQKAISDRYNNEEIKAEAEAAEKKKKIAKDLQDSREQRWKAGSDAIGALLKGDVMAFADATNQIFDMEAQGWQKRLQAHMGGIQAIGQMATQAVAFLNQLSQQRLQTELNNLAKETAAKVEAVNAQKNAVIDGIRAEEQAELDRLRREYLATQMSAKDVETVEIALADAKTAVNQQYQVWMDSARAAGNAAELERLDTERREELKKVEDTVLANQMGAIKLRENEQSLTDQKQAINAQYKVWMDEARAAGNAAELARLQNELAAEQAKLSSSVMVNQMTADQLNSMEAQLADAKQATNAKYKAWMDAARAAGNTAELARLENELAAELKKVDETIRGNELGTATLQKMEQDLATKKTSINTKYNAEITKKTKETTNDIAKIQNDAAVKERDLKREQWKQQKKADTATAIIQGSIAALKALASGFFPVNLVFAGIIAGMTALQVAKIQNQPEPTFAQGGFIARGGKHGPRYGQGGIALIDRGTGREVGEMEGDEAIISADQTEANKDLIHQMFSNARTPSMRKKPVSRANRPMAFRDGGQLFESPYWKKEMYLFGSQKRKQERAKEEAQRQADEAARQAQEEAEALAGSYSSSGSVEGGPDAEAAYADAAAQGKEQLRLLQGIIDSNDANGVKIDTLIGAVNGVKDAANGTTGATYSVRDAVYGAVGDARNGIISALSTLGG